mmetsp:Transcript_71978/g.188638  ORF Transcript_71978/g.188638 Transcript_71978/m.188638 type:complete len:201 (+) Transcript_71978:31-633(+)
MSALCMTRSAHALGLLILWAGGDSAAAEAGRADLRRGVGPGVAAEHPQWVGGDVRRLVSDSADEAFDDDAHDQVVDPNAYDPDDDGDHYDADDAMKAGVFKNRRPPSYLSWIILGLLAVMALGFTAFCVSVRWVGKRHITLSSDSSDDAESPLTGDTSMEVGFSPGMEGYQKEQDLRGRCGFTSAQDGPEPDVLGNHSGE